MEKTITVPGSGRVSVVPDVAGIRLGVNIMRATAASARADAASTMNAVVDAVLATGVARRDVRTSLVSLNPVTDYSDKSGPRVTGYQIVNSVAVTLRDLDKAGELIDAVLAAGASTLDSLDFRLDDQGPAAEQARKLAVDDARSRAATIAAAAGVSLGGVVAVVEGERGGGPSPMPVARAFRAAADAAPTPVEAGTQEISVGVTVTFAID
jgi:uncharacterized protein YggE